MGRMRGNSNLQIRLRTAAPGGNVIGQTFERGDVRLKRGGPRFHRRGFVHVSRLPDFGYQRKLNLQVQLLLREF